MNQEHFQPWIYFTRNNGPSRLILPEPIYPLHHIFLNIMHTNPIFKQITFNPNLIQSQRKQIIGIFQFFS